MRDCPDGMARIAPQQSRNKTIYASAGGTFLNPLLVAAVEKADGFRKDIRPTGSGKRRNIAGGRMAHMAPDAKSGRASAPMTSLYWGPAYSNEEIKRVLENCKARYRWCDSGGKKK